ncbi:hypothetical protein CYY_007685 [Polysphondylium violaceum]|uniref:Uncharacterized protein n=1 Tax=Polysphondylium violaceum TaxID=133409 RepID=A0A8J4PN59_9MYCE|nr:hypothetical protein CYY_007685 [Polysphondylium violaceum]
MSDDEALGLTDIFPTVVELEKYKYNFYDNVVIEIKGQELQNVNVQPSTGLLPWPASTILSQYISKFNDNFKDKNIVELGSGVGICGLVASKYASYTVFTDGDPQSNKLLFDNIKDNNHLYKNNSNYSNQQPPIELLSWGKTSSLEDFKEKYNDLQFQVVIGSDLVYVDENIDPLFYTVDKILSTSSTPSPAFYLSFLDRKNHLPTLQSVSEKYNFTMETIDLDTFLDYKPSTMSRMFVFKRK